MTDIILSDLDSTLADTRGRAHLAAAPGPHNNDDWIPYSQACETDLPLLGSVRALQLFKASGLSIFLVSGRNVEAYDHTVRWLEKFGIPWDSLRMRSNEDIQHNGEYKVAYVQHLRSIGYNPVLMLEDHVEVSEMVEAIGVPVLSVNPRYEDPVGVFFNNLSESR